MQTKSPHRLGVLSLILVILTVASTVFTQVRMPVRGPKADSPFSSAGVDSVNLTNGNLLFSMPLASLPRGRGESPDFPISIRYNSKLWDARREERFDGIPDENGSTRYFAELAVPSEHGGWSVGIGYRLIVRFRNDVEPRIPCDGSAEMQKNAYAVRTSMLFPDGTERELRPLGHKDLFGDGYFNVTPNGLVSQWSYGTLGDGAGACSLKSTQSVTGGMTYYTTDGSYIRVVVGHVPGELNAGRDNPWSMHMPDGKLIENLPSDASGVMQKITDRNGNATRLRRGLHEGVESTIVEDDFGRKTAYQSTILGDKVIRTGFRGEKLETIIEWGTAHVRRIYNAAEMLSLNAPPHMRALELYHAIPVVRRIKLPDQLGGTTYEFGYNASDLRPDSSTVTKGWGELVSMKIPTGARIGYRYSLDEAPPLSVSLDIVKNSVVERSITFSEEYDGQAREVTERTAYRIGPDAAFVTHPDGTVSESRFVSEDSATCDSGATLSSKGPDGSVTEYLWSGGCVNRYARARLRSVPNSAGVPTFTAVTETVLDRNGNVLEEKEYDWVPFSSVPRSGGRVSGLPGGMRLLRRKINTYHNPTPPDDGTIGSPPLKVRNALKSTRLEDPSGAVVSYSEFEYDDASERANVTAARVWDSTKGPLGALDPKGFRLGEANSNSVRRGYDRYGNVLLTTDGRGFSTELQFDSAGLYPNRKADAVGTSVSKTEEFEHDFDTGLVTRTVAVGNTSTENIEVLFEYDAAGRKTREISAKGTSAEAHRVIEYHDGRRMTVTRSDVKQAADGNKISVEHFDQLGRLRLTRTLDKPSVQNPFDESTGIKVQKRYATREGVVIEADSSPYRSVASTGAGQEEGMGWKVIRNLSGGRIVESEIFEGAAPPAPWGGNTVSKGVSRQLIDGDKTMSTDEAGVRTVSRVDASGNQTDVWELSESGDGKVVFGGVTLKGYRTSYLYGASGDLLRVAQGAQTRTFAYDSLSRLTSVTQPESGTSRFTHDPNGNLRSRSDARGVETYYFYDALNRLVNRSYTLSDKISGYRSQPAVTYSYDDMAVPFARGRLSRVHSGISDTRIRAFDPKGRILAFEQMTDGRPFSSGYRYDLTGRIIEEHYPSGRVVRVETDEAGESLGIFSGRSAGDPRKVHASAIERDASGNLISMRYGNGLWESVGFNTKSAVTAIAVGTSRSASNFLSIRNRFNGTDNGNLTGQTIGTASSGVREQRFSYDEMNRLTSASENLGSTRVWNQSFTYDRFGNRTFSESSTSTLPKNCRAGTSLLVCSSDRKKLNPAVASATNRLLQDQDGDKVDDYRYDPAGNLLRDALGSGFVYDGENRQASVKDAYGNIIGEYFYDGFGRRVKKVTFVNNRPDETTVFVYAPDGRTIAEYSDKPARHLGGSTVYVTPDHLGSPRLLTDQFARIVSRHDYLPFGEEFGKSSSVETLRKKYTGYERDVESGLDYAGARYYSAAHARFTTPDPSNESMVPANPQSWNRYSYVLNNPLRFRDPSGELWVLNTGGDRVRNPYRWVDTCGSGQTCWKSVAFGTGDGVRVYGSRSADDISNYFANQHGQMNLESLLSHRDSNFTSVAMYQGIPEPYLSIKAAVALFNVGSLYKDRFAGDQKLVFTNGNGADGKPCSHPDGRPCHSGHRGGDADLRYMDGEGHPLVGMSASARADGTRTRFIVESFKRMGFCESFSGDPQRLGTLPASAGNKKLHRNHLHVGVFDSQPAPQPVTRKKRRTR